MADVAPHRLPTAGIVDQCVNIDGDAAVIPLQTAAAGALKHSNGQLAVANASSTGLADENPLAVHAMQLADAQVHLAGINEDTGRLDWVRSIPHASPNGIGGFGLRAKLLNGACADGVDLDIMQNNSDASGLQLDLNGSPSQYRQPRMNGCLSDLDALPVKGRASIAPLSTFNTVNGMSKPLPAMPHTSLHAVNADDASQAASSSQDDRADTASNWRVRTASLRQHGRNPSVGSSESKFASDDAIPRHVQEMQTFRTESIGYSISSERQTLEAESNSRATSAVETSLLALDSKPSEEISHRPAKDIATTPDLMELYASALALEAGTNSPSFSSAPFSSPIVTIPTPSHSTAKYVDAREAQIRLQPTTLSIAHRNLDRLKQQGSDNPQSLGPLTISPASYFPQQDPSQQQMPIPAVIPPTPPTSSSQDNSAVTDRGEGTSVMFLAAPKASLKRKTSTSTRQIRTSVTDPASSVQGTIAQPIPSATYPPLTPSGRFNAEVSAAARSSPQRMSPVRNASLSVYNDGTSQGINRKVSMSASPRRALSYLAPERAQTSEGSALSMSPGTTSSVLLDPASDATNQLTRDPLQDDIARQAEQIRRERFSKRLEQEKAHAAMLAMQQEARELREGRSRQRTLSILGKVTPQTVQPGNSDAASNAQVPADIGDAMVSPRPPPLILPSSQLKGKGRERGGSISFLGHDRDDVLPDSPKSGRSMGWASPTAGEKSLLREGPNPLGSIPDRATVQRSKSAGGFSNPERVVVGKLIGEDHVNYVLMYNMLTGIRIGVSRCEAKIKRPLTDADYKAQHKFSFDIIGNELTPSAKYDFKFKDYAPWVFRELREHFHLDPADYLLSLTAKYILSELGSPGKSGSFFYFSRDYRFIIKTISHTEHRFLRMILKQYHRHVLDNPHTLLSRFYGLHRVKLPRGRKIHFVIMNNLFPPHKDVHEKYDLKGSSVGREYPEDKAVNNPGAILKDLNWIHRHRQIELGPYKRSMLHEQLQRDVALLKRMNIMDYSLLIGTHDMGLGNSEKLRDGMLTVFQPDTAGKLRRRPTQRGDFERLPPSSTGSDLRKAIQRADPTTLSQDSAALPEQDRAEKRYFAFYQDEGGLRATDESDRNLNTIYYLGVIDILTPYNWYKRVEHFWRSMQYDKHRISAVPPREYGDRFLGFMTSIVRNGDQSQRPKME